MKINDTYLIPTISGLNLEDVNSWWDIDIDETKNRKKKKKKKAKKKKAARKRKKALKKRKKKAKKKFKKSKKIAQIQYEKEFRYQLISKAADTACDITKMYFYKKFGSPA